MLRQPRLPLEPRMRDSGVDKWVLETYPDPRGVPPVRGAAEPWQAPTPQTALGEPQEEPAMQFWKMPVSVASRTDLNPIDKLVYSYLMDKQGGNGSSWPSLSTISVAIGSKERTVRRSCQNLKKYGLVTEKLRPGTSSVWTVNTPDENDPSPICQYGQNGDHTPAKMAAYSDSTRHTDSDLGIQTSRKPPSEPFDERPPHRQHVPDIPPANLPSYGRNGSPLNEALAKLGLKPYGMLSFRTRQDIDNSIENTSEHIACFHVLAAAALPEGSPGRTLRAALRAATTEAACAGSNRSFEKAKREDENNHNHLSPEELKAIFNDRR